MAMYPWITQVPLPDLSLAGFEAHITAVRTPATARKYRQGAEKFLGFCGHHGLVMAKLPPGILGLFAEALVQQGLKPRSVHVMVTAARRYLEWCRARGEAIPNLPKTDLPKPEHELPVALKGDHLVVFMRLAAKLPEPSRTAILLLPYCGLRGHELVTLPLNAVQQYKVTTREGVKLMYCLTVRGKGAKVRVVPLILDGPAILRLYIRKWRSQIPGKWMFPMPDGTHVSDRTIRHHVFQIARLMGAKKISPHTLRKTYLTTLHKAGLDTMTLAAIGGHASVQTTYRHYIDMSPDDIAEKTGAIAPRLVFTGPNDHLIKPAFKSIDALLNEEKPEDDQ